MIPAHQALALLKLKRRDARPRILVSRPLRQNERMAKARYLKNAWPKKDTEGDYWLHIESDGLSAVFCLTESMDLTVDENSIIRRTLESWFAEQDRENGGSET